MDNRAVSPVIEKTIAIGLVVLFVSGLGGTLLGGTVPDYRSAVGQEVGERTLATAAMTVQSAIPAGGGAVSVEKTATLPATINDRGYRLELSGRTLRLVHPSPWIGASTRLAIPSGVTVRNGSWTGGQLVVRVGGPAGNRTITIEGG